jgi:hypothetical protein
MTAKGNKNYSKPNKGCAASLKKGLRKGLKTADRPP